MKKSTSVMIIIVSLIVMIVSISSCVASMNSTSDNYSYNYDSNYGSSYGGSSGGHTCYVCGDSGNIKYGSHYYCSTHYAYTKTIVDSYN